MTLQNRRRKSNGKVFPVPNSPYVEWRARYGIVPALREGQDSPPERLLQAVWQHQRLLRSRLTTLDGQPVRILHPGFANHEGGPDFRGAVIQVGDAPAQSGDVEVDVQAGGWRAHGHDRNPAFRNVILHAIWDGERSAFETAARVPGGTARTQNRPLKGATELQIHPATLVLRPFLDAPIGELNVWLGSEAAETFPENLRGRCCAPLRDLSVEKVVALLRQAADIRFRSKAAHFQARARQVGWEQSLWEGIFRALGYKHNIWPMLCLAEQRDRWFSARTSPLELQARLLGLSGLLPWDLTRAQTSADGYLRSVWDRWWRERDAFADCLLPRSLWRFHGQRPANHPQRRLALAAHWLAAGSLAAKIERWCAMELADEKLAGALLDALKVEPDKFWSWHWTIRSERLKRPQPLLGLARVTDLAVNVILPWLWIRSVEGKNQRLQNTIEHRFNIWPAGEDNLVLRHARQRLLGGMARRGLQGAAEQQGLIQIVRDFCDHSNSVCDNCRFPELVREWNQGNALREVPAVRRRYPERIAAL